MSARVMVRLPEQLEAWLDELGGDRATTLKALAVLGAAQLGLPGADALARRLSAGVPGPGVAVALAGLWQPHGSRMAAAWQPSPERPVGVAEMPAAGLLDELLGVGIEV